MIQNIKKFKKIFINKIFPLTKKPKNIGLSTSDLFLWRVDENWETFFNIININSLFGDTKENFVKVVLFNEYGIFLFEKVITLKEYDNQLISIKKIFSNAKVDHGVYGTFSIFHSKTPPQIIKSDSFLAERGYVSYKYSKSILRSYVHGNLDAIDENLAPLSGSMLFARTYKLQYLFNKGGKYQISIFNPTSVRKKIEIHISDESKNLLDIRSLEIYSKGVNLLSLEDIPVDYFISIKSKQAMARPIVFSFQNKSMDVFHG